MQLSWNRKEIKVIGEYLRKLAMVYDAIIEEMDERGVDSIRAPMGSAVHWINRTAKTIILKQKPAVDKGMHEAEVIRDNPKYREMIANQRPRTKNGRHKTAEEVLEPVLETIDQLGKIYPSTKRRSKA